MLGKNKRKAKEPESKKPTLKIEEERKYNNGELISHTFTITKLIDDPRHYSYNNYIVLSAERFEELKQMMLNPTHELVVENKTNVTIPKE